MAGYLFGAGAHLALDALNAADFVALMTKGANKSITATASTDKVNATAHGYSNGDVVRFTGLTGGTGLVNGQPYFVVGAATNDFQVAHTSGGSAIDITVDYSAGTVNKYTEISGGSPAYARKSSTWNAAAGRNLDNSNAPVFDVPAAAVVDAVAGNDSSTAGTWLTIFDVTQETFGAQGTYTVNDLDIQL